MNDKRLRKGDRVTWTLPNKKQVEGVVESVEGEYATVYYELGASLQVTVIKAKLLKKIE